MSDEKRPIIIVKKISKGHGAHHGGAWKVAYADFVTAMMAFFMVMWIVGMDQSVKSAVEGYFKDPVGFSQGRASSPNPISVGASPRPDASMMPVAIVSRRIEEQRFRTIGDSIKLKLEGPEGLGEIAAQVEVVMTDEGLRIELIEGGDGEMFFGFASAQLKPAAERAIRIIASGLGASNAPVVLEGHTDAARFSARNGYSNWELSADRANAARRVIEDALPGSNRVVGVRGYADEHLRVPENPLDNSNRRISILRPFPTAPVVEERAPTAAAPPVMPPTS